MEVPVQSMFRNCTEGRSAGRGVGGQCSGCTSGCILSVVMLKSTAFRREIYQDYSIRRQASDAVGHGSWTENHLSHKGIVNLLGNPKYVPLFVIL